MHADGNSPLLGLLGASFSASADYQTLFPGGQAGPGGAVYVATTATCTSYFANWNQFAFQPNFTSNFQAAVAGLGTSVSWLEFVEAFGMLQGLVGAGVAGVLAAPPPPLAHH